MTDHPFVRCFSAFEDPICFTWREFTYGTLYTLKTTYAEKYVREAVSRELAPVLERLESEVGLYVTYSLKKMHVPVFDSNDHPVQSK